MAISVEMIDFADRLDINELDATTPESTLESVRSRLLTAAIPADERDGATHLYSAPNGSLYLVRAYGHVVNGSRDVYVCRAIRRENRGVSLGQRIRVSLRMLDRL